MEGDEKESTPPDLERSLDEVLEAVKESLTPQSQARVQLIQPYHSYTGLQTHKVWRAHGWPRSNRRCNYSSGPAGTQVHIEETKKKWVNFSVPLMSQKTHKLVRLYTGLMKLMNLLQLSTKCLGGTEGPT